MLVHQYGPHIFHTDDAEVWSYVNRFERFLPYRHRVRAQVKGRVYSLPMNLLTINQFFGQSLRPDEAQAFVEARADLSIKDPQSFKDQALRFIGPALYEAFFEGYTRKQWGRDPATLPASILKRLPVRFSYNDDYFAHRFQGMPEGGYSAMVERMLDHPLIRVSLNTAFEPAMQDGAAHVFWSGPLDAWFGFDEGRLGYRTLDFERFTHRGDWQGCAVMNYCDADVPWTRITEHKHFAPWEQHDGSVLFREHARECGPGDQPYYPIRLVRDQALLGQYVKRAYESRGVTFVGRLGTYRYLDMDNAIREALDTGRRFLQARHEGGECPAFVYPPL